MSQTSDILDWLNAGHTITPLEALNNFGCLRLAARIADIRAKGIEVETEAHVTGKGKTVARYFIKPPAQMELPWNI